jgi:hypothetical protein
MEHSTLLKGKAACLGWLLFALAVPGLRGDDPQQNSPADQGPAALKKLSLEQLSQLEVTTVSKKPEKAFQTPAAIFVITGDVRGFGSRLSRSVLVMIDGRTVYTPLFAGTYWEVQDTRASQAGFRMEWKPNNNSRYTFTLQGYIYKEEAGESVAAVPYAAPCQRIVDANADLSGGNVMGVWQRKLASGGDFQLQTYYHRTNRYEANLGERRNTFDVDFVEHVTWGEWQRITRGLGTRFSRADDLEVTAGTKLLRTSLTGFEFDPSVRLAWTPSENETVWEAFTHAARTPSAAEENFYLSGFVGITPGGVPEMARFTANPNFAPEQMSGYQLGYQRLRGSYSFLHMNLAKSPHSGDVGTAPGIVGSSLQHEGWIQSSLDQGKSFQLDLTYRHESALPGQLEPAYFTGDARFAWRGTPELELSPVGQNLLQPFHREFGGDPGALAGIRRSAYLKLTWSR